VFATLTEMSFASHLGLNIDLDEVIVNCAQAAPALFSERACAVVQVNESDVSGIVRLTQK